jgi:para-aminobenzoate synthetase component 1
MKNPEVFSMDELPAGIHFTTPHFATSPPEAQVNSGLVFKAFPPAFAEYQQAFGKVKTQIRLGNSYLLNLTFASRVETNLSLPEIYNLSSAPYKLLYKNKFVVFSPETFVTIKDGLISSFPMKGTIDATLPNAERTLLEDRKEHAEHNTIVDLIRNDLAMVAEDVVVERFKFLQKVKTHNGLLLQMSSKITGTLPAGSISGAPKQKTLEIIRASENYHRGYYTGIFGHYDGKNLHSAVMIRFIERSNGQLFFKSGGGITSLSRARTEYDELLQKIYLPIAK